MGWIGTIIVGFIIGLLARFLHPGKDKLGIIMTVILGISGSVLAGFLGEAIGLYKNGEAAGFIASTLSAVLILVIFSKMKK